ncbi:hypothetical protein ABZ780_29260 [Micromonospora sp. NPDC047467]|uniref:hypothetical protein n=1 Tax=Micromonospora sp. NPDC047467 TaxID=3154814 RepID=UPI00340597D0
MSRIRSALAMAACLVLLAPAAGCSKKDKGEAVEPQPSSDLPSPTVRTEGDAIVVAVAPDRPLAVAVPGLGHLTAPSGAFATAGKVVVHRLRSDNPDGSLVVVGGMGVDVAFEGTSLASPITILFDDPGAMRQLPKAALPVVLHKPDGGGWEAKSVSRTADGVPYISTKDFSPNLFGWIPVPDWVRELADSFADFTTQRTDARPCSGLSAPSWSSIDKRTTMVHLCAIANADRAEIQVQSNRRFYQWVAVPAGADYVWVEGQPDLLRRVVANVTGHDAGSNVLLAGNGWFTAGYKQPEQTQRKNFNAYLDPWSAGLSVGMSVLGLDPRQKVTSAAWIVGMCINKLLPFPSADGAEAFLGCFVTQALKNLDNPDVAFKSAKDLYGEAAYAKEAEEGLKQASDRLRYLGKLLKVLGIITSTFPQLPDLFSSWGNDQPGRFMLHLTAKPTSPTGGTTTQPPPPRTQAPPPRTQAPPPPPAGSPRIDLARGGAAPFGSWYNVTLSGFTPGAAVTVTCRDSRDPGGFYSQKFTIGGDGRAADSTLCYSADGPDHWVTGGGIESNHVSWGNAPPPPPAGSPRIDLARGGAAPFGSWYNVTLSGFTPGAAVTVTCRDSRDPGGFYSQKFTIGGDGRAADSTLCYSADGPDHWVTGGGIESNHVAW